MNEKEINKYIGYGLFLIVSYFVVQAFIGYIIWGVIGLVVLQIYRSQNRK